MTSKVLDVRRTRQRAPRRRGWLRATVETLEARSLLSGTIPSGIYTEDFSLNTDPTKGGFDVGGAFSTQITDRGVNEKIIDPSQTEGSNGGWFIHPDSDDSSNFELELQGSIYEVTFPNLPPDVHVAGAAVDVDSEAQKWKS